MEKNIKRIRKRKSIWKSECESESVTTSSISDFETIFPLILAALSKSPENPYYTSVIKKCLSNLRFSLHSKSSISSGQTFPLCILSFIPILLRSKNVDIARRSAKIVGAAALLSFEMNEQIASDSETVNALVSLVVSSNKRVSIDACAAVLDLSTTSFGRQRLLQLSALERLMFKLLQVPKKSTSSVILCTEDEENVARLNIRFMDDKFAVSLLDAVIALINTCSNVELEHIPGELSECFSAFLKEKWGKVRDQMFLGKISRSSHERKSFLSNFTINNLAESLFRLSLNRNKCTTYPHKMVISSIFGSSGPNLKSFLLEYWEISPLLVERTLNDSTENFFRSITHSLYPKGSLYSSSSSILQNLISCLPIDSDELDILNFLKETRNTLGCPLIYEQDLRVVKTDNQTKSEVHFFPEDLNSPCCMKLPPFLYVDDISKCEEALKKGYTIALRGAEFRFESVASFADGLASLFGQPSVGANLYLTPPNSQGLALHYDDHCVFVCQLLGKKKWKISSQPCVQLPRLYAPLDTINSEGLDSSMNECINCMLKEGDVLYIPRGYPHEASTEKTEPDGSAEFSLHLTLAIEVEPPFEWEGFVHVAVCFWCQTPNQYHQASTDPLSKALHIMSINLLHVIIGLIADSDHNFRKACLVAASFLPPDTTEWLHLNQETTFCILIDRIRSVSESTFSSALKIVEAAIRNDEDPFQRMKWLESFDLEGETSEVHGWILPFTGIKNLLPIYIQHKDIAESILMQVKAKFCDEISYEQAVHPYKRLLEKYRKARKQYINGMLSLHSN